MEIAKFFKNYAAGAPVQSGSKTCSIKNIQFLFC